MEEFWTEFWKGLWDINIKDVVYIIATIITVWFAISGYNKWKKELRWKTYFDFAQRFLKSAYTLRNVLHAERVKKFYLPILLQNDEDQAEERLWDIYEHHKKEYNERITNVKKAAIVYESLLTEGEVLFDDFRERAQKLMEHMDGYIAYANLHIKLQYAIADHEVYPELVSFHKTDVLPVLEVPRGGKDQDPVVDSYAETTNHIIENLDVMLIEHIRPKRRKKSK